MRNDERDSETASVQLRSLHSVALSSTRRDLEREERRRVDARESVRRAKSN